MPPEFNRPPVGPHITSHTYSAGREPRVSVEIEDRTKSSTIQYAVLRIGDLTVIVSDPATLREIGDGINAEFARLYKARNGGI
jgi:hypothetical protein